MLPDFQFETPLEGCLVYPTHGGAGPQWVTPRGVALAPGEDGLPDFRLALVRAPGLTPRTSARLDLRLEAAYDLAGAGERLGVPAALLAPLLPTSGHLRLTLPLSGAGLDETLSVPLAWNGLGRARVTWRLSAEAGAVLRGALAGGTLALGANVVLALRGVAARGTGEVTFDPQALVRALSGVRDERGRTTDEALRAFFREPWDGRPWRWRSRGAEDAQPWAALLDRCLARFARLAPPEGGDLSPALTFGEPPPGEMTWALGDVVETWRPVALEWRPLDGLRAGEADPERFITLVSAPPLPRGSVGLEAVGNLPGERVNVPQVGAHVTVAARPPARPQPAQATLVLEPPRDTATTTLRLSPGESLTYETRPYLLLSSVVGAGPRTRVLTGPPLAGTGGTLELGVADLPAHFYPLAAEPALLERAVLTGAVAWTEGAEEHRVPVRLERSRPEVCVAVPTGAEPSLRLRAESLTGGGTLELPALDVSERSITLWHLPGFGAQTVRFVWRPTGTAPGLDLEVEPEAGGPPTRLHLRRDRPGAEWSYVVDDPFRPRYRFRVLPDGAWAAYVSPLDTREVTLTLPQADPTEEVSA